MEPTSSAASRAAQKATDPPTSRCPDGEACGFRDWMLVDPHDLFGGAEHSVPRFLDAGRREPKRDEYAGPTAARVSAATVKFVAGLAFWARCRCGRAVVLPDPFIGLSSGD